MSRRILSCVVFVLVAVPALALAKPRVALVPLDNDSGGDVQDAVVDALGGDELALVGPKQVARAADKLGLEGTYSDKELKKLANELDADAVIQASVSTKGSNKVLHFKLFVHGKKQKGFKIEFGSPKSKKFKSALHDKMVEKLGDVGGKGDDDDKGSKKKSKAADDDENPLPAATDKDAKKKGKKADKEKDDDVAADDKPSKKKKDKKAEKAEKAEKADKEDKADKDKSADDDAGGDDKVAKNKSSKSDDDSGDDKAKKDKGDDDASGGDDDKPKKKRTASADDDGGGDDGGEVRGHVDLATAPANERTANRAAIRVDAGVSVTGRSLTFNSRIFTEGTGNPKPYSNAPVPGARLEAEVFPLAVSNPNGAAAGLGLAAMYDKTISLGLHNALMPTATYTADEFRWNIGARYRYVFGAKPTSPSVTLGFDYGHRQFKVTNRPAPDTGIVIDIPDVEYVGVTPSVTLRVPLAPAVALIAGGGSFLAFKAGAIQNPEQYGQARVTEFEAMGGLDVVLTKRVALRFTGEFALFGFQFVGNGAMANARDGDPSNIDVGGASDRYIGGAATIAVLY